MSTNFERRKAKVTEAVSKAVEAKKETVRAEAAGEPSYDQSAYDVFTADGGKSFGVAEIAYNPATGEATVKDTFSISRLIALQYANQKTALGILKQKKQTNKG